MFPGVYADSGLFVCLEGGEGAGKSTQARLLQEWLEATGRQVLLTYEPGDTAVGQEIRRIVLDPDTGHLAPEAEALLYAADKAEHLDKVVRPALAEGRVVITDRYVDSTLAYQGAGRAIDPEGLEQVARWATGDMRPHLTVLLDLDPEVAMARFDGRDRIEGEPLEFHQRVRAEFQALAAVDPDHYLVLDASAHPQDLAAAIQKRVGEMLTTPTEHSLRSFSAGDPGL